MDVRSWAPGPLGCSVSGPAAGGRKREDRLPWEQAAERPLEVVGSCLSQGGHGSPCEAEGRHEWPERHGSWACLPVTADQALERSLVFGHGWGGLQDTRSSCPHTGERGQEHERGRPWAKSRPARMSAGRASSCPERGQRPVPGCRAAPEHSRGWREPEATPATMVTGLRGGCELQGVPPFFS